jgi:hypothetical protein
MAKFTVHTPEAGWSGEVGNVTFTGGAAIIDDQVNAAELAYCRTAGYQVDPADEPEPETKAPARRASAKKDTQDGDGQ